MIVKLEGHVSERNKWYKFGGHMTWIERVVMTLWCDMGSVVGCEVATSEWRWLKVVRGDLGVLLWLHWLCHWIIWNACGTPLNHIGDLGLLFQLFLQALHFSTLISMVLCSCFFTVSAVTPYWVWYTCPYGLCDLSSYMSPISQFRHSIRVAREYN